MQKNYGFVAPKIVEDKEFRLGQLAQTVINPSGDWTGHLPLMEDQRLADGSDSFACTTFGTHNAFEILFKYQYGIDTNLSDRFLAIYSKIIPPGADPQVIAQNLRHAGAILEARLSNSPACKNIREFYSPDPLPTNLTDEGKQWLAEWVPGHEWVVSGSLASVPTLKYALTLSPLCIAVYAWNFDGKGYTRPLGAPDTHWCTLVKIEDGEYPFVVFDSVEGDLKRLREDFGFRWVKRYSLDRNDGTPTTEQRGIIKRILDAIQNIIAAMFALAVEPKPLPPRLEPIDYVPLEIPIEPPKPESPPRVSRIEDWARAIEKMENMNKSFNNPGALRNSPFQNGTRNGYATFISYDMGWKALIHQLTIAANGQSKVYKPTDSLLRFFEKYAPVADKNNPLAYATHVATALSVGIDTEIGELL